MLFSHRLLFVSLFLCYCVVLVIFLWFFFFSSRRRHTRCALVTGVQTCALPIFAPFASRRRYDCKRLQLGGVESGLAAKPINHILGLCIILPTVVPTNANPKINGRPTTVAIGMRPPALWRSMKIKIAKMSRDTNVQMNTALQTLPTSEDTLKLVMG